MGHKKREGKIWIVHYSIWLVNNSTLHYKVQYSVKYQIYCLQNCLLLHLALSVLPDYCDCCSWWWIKKGWRWDLVVWKTFRLDKIIITAISSEKATSLLEQSIAHVIPMWSNKHTVGHPCPASDQDSFLRCTEIRYTI